MRFEQLEVGQCAEFVKTVTEEDICKYAEVTGDFNPLHFDETYASQTIFKGRIAHGMIAAGYISAVLGTELPGAGTIYLDQSMRFTKPVRIGDKITAHVEVIELIPGKRRVRLATSCRNQSGEVVLDGEATVMMQQ